MMSKGSRTRLSPLFFSFSLLALLFPLLSPRFVWFGLVGERGGLGKQGPGLWPGPHRSFVRSVRNTSQTTRHGLILIPGRGAS